ncbi:hypothetical protein ABB05_04925 [Lederbergia galactosidilytica]|uniref:Uncharacterized protein n=1 Tax=Lederbergia galactosidilytica TaxID=217031 RepID=A0A178A2T1_9BACI|nr:hypothetical protein ABB05_04925 [Lederbergia galactosidilytica]
MKLIIIIFNTIKWQDELCYANGPDSEWIPLAKSCIVIKIGEVYIDRQMNIDEIIMETKQLKPPFASGKGKRAHYANLNYSPLYF